MTSYRRMLTRAGNPCVELGHDRHRARRPRRVTRRAQTSTTELRARALVHAGRVRGGLARVLANILPAADEWYDAAERPRRDLDALVHRARRATVARDERLRALAPARGGGSDRPVASRDRHRADEHAGHAD